MVVTVRINITGSEEGGKNTFRDRVLSCNRLALIRWLLCVHTHLTLEPRVHSADGNSGAGGRSGATPTHGPTLSELFAGGFPILKPVVQRDKDSPSHPGVLSSPDPLLYHVKINSNENDLLMCLAHFLHREHKISLFYSNYFHIVLT